MTECPNCEKPVAGASCRLCGWSPLHESAKAAAKVPETHRPWQPPAYREPTDAEVTHVKGEIAKFLDKLAALPPLERKPRTLSQRLGMNRETA
jgi:hypothetical protein